MSNDPDKRRRIGGSRLYCPPPPPPIIPLKFKLCSNEISTWAYEPSQLLPPCHCRYISSSLTALNGLQSLPDILNCSSESGQDAFKTKVESIVSSIHLP